MWLFPEEGEDAGGLLTVGFRLAQILEDIASILWVADGALQPFLGLCAIEHYREDRFRQAISLLGLFGLSILLLCDYGCAGFSFIVMLYLLRQHPLFRAIQ